MTYMPMTAESLSEQLGESVPDLYVLIAKNEIMELELEDIARILGVGASEVREAVADPIYKSVRLILGASISQQRMEVEEGWDALERISVSNLVKKAQFTQDPELLLRMASVANRAQRRIVPKNAGVIDPSQAGKTVQVTLTQRMVERLSATHSREVVQTKQLSLLDGSAKNPSFGELSELLGEVAMPTIEQRLSPPHVIDDAIDSDDMARQLLADMGQRRNPKMGNQPDRE